MSSPPVLLYDGQCSFCDGMVRFVLRYDRRGALRFAPLDGEFGRRVLSGRLETRGVDSLILVEPSDLPGTGCISMRSEAAITVATHLGGWWRMAALLRIVPIGLRDVAYDVFARHRHRLFGRRERCSLPAPEHRARFLA